MSKTNKTSADSAEAMKKYLANKKVLLVDTQSVARSLVFQLMRDLGANPTLITLANSYAAAEQQIRDQRPHVVVAEYELGSRSGLDLLREQREALTDLNKSSIFILVTGNTSQAAVARALEEEVDAFILKPFSPNAARNSIMKAALSKIKPSPYFQKIEAAKQWISEGQLGEAARALEEAKRLDPNPALACYYLAQIEQVRKMLKNAEVRYQEGLGFNQIHYKCLVGLYDLQMKEGRHEAAYDIVKRVSRYFPANPKRLTEVIRLAVLTGKFSDIERYYRIFMTIDERNPELVRYAVSGLIVCAKHYLSSRMANGRAVELYERAVLTAENRSRLLASVVIPTLLEFGLLDEAQRFLSKFPPEDCFSDEFLSSRFFVAEAKKQDAMAFEQGRALLAKGFKGEAFFRKILGLAVRNHMELLAHEVMSQAVQAFPSQRQEFERIHQELKKRAS
jgi:CheY-like chemotaxis protein